MKKLFSALVLLCSTCVGCTDSSTPNDTATVKTKNQLSTSDTPKTVDKRPNIFLLMFEDLSPRIGAYGDDLAVTPVTDRMAKEGILFNNAFTTAGVCSPSRSSLITGVHQQTLGTMHMRTASFRSADGESQPYETVIPASIKAFPELLRRAGYFTINDHKTDYQFGNPFTVWDISEPQAAWQSLANDKPVFAMVNFFTSHESFTWLPNDTYQHPMANRIRQRNKKFDQGKVIKTDPSKIVIPPYYPDVEGVANNIARHYDNIAATDRRLGEFLTGLEEQGLLENSIIIVTSDHGDGLPRAKRALYDSGIAVPLIVRFPTKLNAGDTRDDLVSFVDIAPTILSLAGAEIPSWMQGRVFLGEQRQTPPDTIFAAADRIDQSSGRIKAARNANFKYIRNYQPESPRLPFVSYQDVNPIMQIMRKQYANGDLHPTAAQYFDSSSPAQELYDLSNDPHEINNIANDPTYKVELTRLSDAMDGWLAKTGDLSAINERQMLASMWPNGRQPITDSVRACLSVDNRIVLTSATHNASIGFRRTLSESEQNMKDAKQQEKDVWSLYTEPVLVKTIEAKAIRYGFKESVAVQIDHKRLASCQ